MTKQRDNLVQELSDNHSDLLDSLDVLIAAEWDAPRVKIKLAGLLKQHYRLIDGLDLYDSRLTPEKNKESKA